MKTTLPAPRELPPRRRAQIRDTLVRTVERGDRRAHRWRAPALIAGVATATVAAVVGVLSWPAEPPVGLERPVSNGGGRPILAELSAKEKAAIETDCATSAARPKVQYELRNLIEDRTGRLGFLYSDEGGLICTRIGTAGEYSGARTTDGPLAQLVTPMSMETGERSDEGFRAGMPGYDEAAGRVSKAVARVTYTAVEESGQSTRRRTVDASVHNGTFLVRMLHSAKWRRTAEPGVLRAYSATGRPLQAATVPPVGRLGQPEVAGLSSNDALEVALGCMPGEMTSGSFPGLYNVVSAPGKRRPGLVYLQDRTEAVAVLCHIDTGRQVGMQGVDALDWISGDLTVDAIFDAADGSGTFVAGRFNAPVERVRFTAGDRTYEAEVANGTFLVRIDEGDARDGAALGFDGAGNQVAGAEVKRICGVNDLGLPAAKDSGCAEPTPWAAGR